MRKSIVNTICIIGTAAAMALFPTTLVAGGVTDGRTGPAVMNDHLLDHALVSLNDFLQVKYAQDDLLGSLDTVPNRDFRTVAIASAETPFDSQEAELGPFGWTVTGGTTLDFHLASFNEEVLGRRDSLFVRIARAETGKAMTFDQAAADYKSDTRDGGRIHDDPSLNAEVLALSNSLREFDNRFARISQTVPEVTGTSFERYMDALALY